MSAIDPTLLESGIAIIGLAGRYPGASNVDTYWDNVRNGVESIEQLSEQALLENGVPQHLLKDPHYVRASGSLADVPMFDAGYFGLSPMDAAITDPQHRHFLECAVEAFENAGHSTERYDGAIGVFAGCGMNSYFVNNLLTNPEMLRNVGLFLLRHTGNDRDFLPTTVSYKLNLRGPSVAIQTACSTSLVAIHMACQSLLSGECEMALAGGSTIIVPNGQGYVYRDNEPVSPDGHCRAFDADSAGTVLTSGAGAIVLRRLEDALEDGDTIHAVIRGSAINNDGAGKVGFLAPSVEGHASVVAEALSVADVSADTVDYVEAHGTGTRVGDPIEISALTQAFRATTERTGYCRIGSVKTNIGHLDTAAGVASLTKVVQALKAREMPPSLHFKRPNPEIDFDNSPFVVNDALRPWASDGKPRRAGVSSLGIGGTNSHVLLEEAPALPPTSAATRRHQVLPLSAKSKSALDAAAADLADWLSAHPDADLADVAFTLQDGRDYREHRLIVTASDPEDAAAALRERPGTKTAAAKCTGTASAVAFMFSGAGAQYPNMARDLYTDEPTFREAMDRCLDLLSNVTDYDLKAVMYPEPGAEERAAAELAKPSRLLPAVAVTEWSLAQLWQSWGIEPKAMIGHSMGEYVAACLAGVMSLEDMLRLVLLRGVLIDRLSGGAMLSLPFGEDEARQWLGDDLDLAAVNSPGLCVASGPLTAVQALQRRLEAAEIEARLVPVDAAGHSRHLDAILEEFRAGVAKVNLSAPTRPFVSNVTGTWATAEDVTEPDYWVRHLRGTVRFSEGLECLIASDDLVLLEVGPGQTLSTFARQQPVAAHGIVPSIRKPAETVSDAEYAVGAVGKMWLSGLDVDFSVLRPGERRRRIPLPTYPFEHKRYWVEPGVLESAGPENAAPLERLEPVDRWFQAPRWLETPVEPEAPVDGTRTWLVFLDAAGVGARLTEAVRGQGDRVVTVAVADGFFKFDDDAYALAPEAGREAYEELVEALEAADAIPSRIVHLWSLTHDDSYRAGSSLLDRNQECGFYSALYLMQALGEHADELQRIDLIANGVFAVAEGDDVRYPEKATLLGPVRVIPREFPHVACRIVDLSLPRARTVGLKGWVGLTPGRIDAESVHALAATLETEVCGASAADVVAWRDGRRFEQRYQTAPIAAGDTAGIGFREQGVYLVTGGLGGLGFALAERLATEHRARVVLIGRREFPDEQAWDQWLAQHGEDDEVARRIAAIRRIRESGGDAWPVSADVTDYDAMRRLVEEVQQRFGTINGVLHAAGAVSDGVLLTKSKADVEQVFATKVHGTLMLEQVLAGIDLDFFVAFSSTSAVVGLPGQIDYAGANAFLDAFAERRNRQGQRTLALGWGIWNDVGGAVNMARQLRDEPTLASLQRETGHPLLGVCVEEGRKEWRWQARWTARDIWVLDEHRTGEGVALLPGTAYLELARAAFHDRFGESRCQVGETAFLQPLIVDDDTPCDVEMSLREVKEGWEFAVATSGGEAVHATLNLRRLPGTTRPQAPDDWPTVSPTQRREAANGTCLPSAQHAQLGFGPRWSNLRSIGYGVHAADAGLALGSEFAADFATTPLHPALLDIATSIAIPVIEGWQAGKAVYVPLAYGAVRVFAGLQPRIYVQVKSDPANRFDRDVATFDVRISDEHGETLLEIDRYQMRKLDSTRDFAGKAASAPAGGVRHHEPTAIEALFLETYEQGIRVEEGLQALTRALSGVQGGGVVISPLRLDAWRERVQLACRSMEVGQALTFERPELDSEYEAPRNATESELVKMWQEFLGVGQIGIHDDFFDLGGHSLIAVRLFAKLKKQWGIDWPISMLFDAPTVGQFAALVQQELGEPAEEAEARPESVPAAAAVARPQFLVPMNRAKETERLPLFLVAGMFGNVLNLRHLATHLGEDQPVYGLQAKGLYGDEEPHENFVDAARDYLEEVRRIAPTGPYIVGGFSGGGVTAFEMAHQLRQAGEEVAAIILLDSIPPHPAWPLPNALDRMRIRWQRFKQEVVKHPVEWLRVRIRWEYEKRQRRSSPDGPAKTPAEFRSELIERAFRTSLDCYQMRVYPGKLTLFRPPLDKTFDLGGGRYANVNRDLMEHKNWWQPWTSEEVEVRIVPGNHDSMVLEPNVRVLARELRETLDEVQPAKESDGQHFDVRADRAVAG